MLVTATSYKELTASHWSSLPDGLVRRGISCEWSDANRRGTGMMNFLEGPDLTSEGRLVCVDIPAGRILSVSPRGEWDVVCEYPGWPNGLKVQADGRLLVADHKNGLVEVDPATATVTPLLGHRHSQQFLGLNDLHVAGDGTVWFTDQGQTGLHDPSGKVYRWTRGGALTCVLSGLPSPNGIRVSPDGRELYVAVTRDNSVWRAPLMASGEASKVGRFALFYGPVGPDGIHLDSSGRLWVCLPGADTIWVLTPQGEVTRRVRFPQGSLPTNLVVDPLEHIVYVTCSGANAVFTLPFD